jgi:hypothetical protein
MTASARSSTCRPSPRAASISRSGMPVTSK